MKFNIYNKLLNSVTMLKITIDLDPSSIYIWLQISIASIVQATEGKKKGSKTSNIVHQINKVECNPSPQHKGLFGLPFLSTDTSFVRLFERTYENSLGHFS